MRTDNIEFLRANARPVSPDRKYSLAWSSGGTIGIHDLQEGEPLLVFREDHGGILKAGFSPDMQRLIAENEDGTVSIWFTRRSIAGEVCLGLENIVAFMENNPRVPCLNIKPGADGRVKSFRLLLHDFSCAALDYYDWGNDYCSRCGWNAPQPGTRDKTFCSSPSGCEFKPKII